MAPAARLIAAAVLTVVVGSPVPALALQPADAPGPLDRAFARLYNFDFAGGVAILDEMEKAEPQNPLVVSTRAVAFLFMELNRMKILETRFFMNDDNLVDGSSRSVPDPAVRVRLFAALARARNLAKARLATQPDDVEGLFALCMCASVETDYTALVERRTWRSTKLAPAVLEPARKLIARTPPFYDVYVNFGTLEYILGELPFFVRWFVHIDGVKGNKRQGIEQLKLAAYHGRYYAAFARILLVVVSLREKKLADAEELLAGLVRDYPENPVFRNELAVVKQQARRAKQ
jgi:hypothetical protein